MTYYHCPERYRQKAYGCGFGPVNATAALFDLDPAMQCPHCHKELKKVRGPRKQLIATQELLDAAAAAEQLGGKGKGSQYISRHKHRRSNQ